LKKNGARVVAVSFGSSRRRQFFLQLAARLLVACGVCWSGLAIGAALAYRQWVVVQIPGVPRLHGHAASGAING
jgi:hypothetical protein